MDKGDVGAKASLSEVGAGKIESVADKMVEICNSGDRRGRIW